MPSVSSSVTNVLLTEKRNAKVVKVALEKKGFLDKSFRMTRVDALSFTNFVPFQQTSVDEVDDGGDDHDQLGNESSWSTFIAIPIHLKCKTDDQSSHGTTSSEKEQQLELGDDIRGFTVGFARQSCPYSTSVLGNTKLRVKLASSNGRNIGRKNMNLVQTILLDVMDHYHNLKGADVRDNDEKNQFVDIIESKVERQSSITCPPKLEVMGDDRTLVIPFRALNPAIDQSFHNLIQDIVCHATGGAFKEEEEKALMSLLWVKLARSHGSHRVVRRGEIDPNSKVRESGHSILWIDDNDMAATSSENGRFYVDYCNLAYIYMILKLSTCVCNAGSKSRGWITITEQGIRQSFDLTKVMFSRGNISEKIRFGNTVQENDLVLDMYAGIGYYTLPALVHGKARHVYCCEWNPHAAAFLKYNLKQNGVDDRATVLEGDSRVTLLENDILDNNFDRVSLGLLPSSEGGWKTAVKALSRDKGGWLHVHGNVPNHERDDWSLWTCQQLSAIHSDIYPDLKKHYNVICTHVEKVKSFAPKVSHFVADILIAPRIPDEFLSEISFDENERLVGNVKDGKLIMLDGEVPPPSCALGHGVLDQKWMM